MSESRFGVRIDYPLCSRQGGECPDYLGRNGYAKCIGLWLSNYSGIVRLWPINSRGDTGSCLIEIPVEAIPVVIDALIKIASDERA